MSKSIKRYIKYHNDESELDVLHEERRGRLREKRIRAALNSKNVDVLSELTEEEY